MNKRMVAVIKMLSSKYDGEIIAAARSLDKMLSDEGLGWNDLGDYIALWDPKKTKPAPKPAQPAGPPVWPQREAKAGYHRRSTRTFAEPDAGEAKTMIDALNDIRILRRMRRKDSNFIEGMAEKFEQFGDRTNVSAAQFDYIKDLYNRYA